MDQCIQLRLHTLTKRQYLLVYSAFFVAFTVTVVIGAVGPSVLASYSQYLGVEWSATPSNETNRVVFSGRSPPGWSSFSQELWLKCVIHTRHLTPAKQKEQLKFMLRVLSVQGQDASDAWVNLYPGIERFYHARDLKCGESCQQFVVLHLGSVAHRRYEVKFAADDLNKPGLIHNMTFLWQFYSPEFTQMEVWCQFVFIVLTFIAAFQFTRYLRAFSIKEWCMEQKWISFLLVLLVLFNNPLFPLHFLMKQAWGERFFEALFRSTFLCSLLLFWLCFLHAINVSPRKFTTFYLPKVIVVGMVWLASLTLLSWEEYNALSDPSYQLHLDTNSFQAWKIVFYVSFGIYLFYLAYATFRAFGAQSPIDIRLKFFASLLLIVIVISCTVLFVRFGFETRLEPSFVAASTPQYRNGAEFLSLIGVFNYYLYTLAYVYSPSPNAVRESKLTGSTSFSMLYDLDAEEDDRYQGLDQDKGDDRVLWKRSGE